MAVVAFWNINKRKRQGLIGDLVREYAVDIVALAECEIDESNLLYRLNVGQERKYYPVDILPSRVKIYSRYDADWNMIEKMMKFPHRKIDTVLFVMPQSFE